MQYFFFMSCARGQECGHQCDSHVYVGTHIHMCLHGHTLAQRCAYALCSNKLKDHLLLSFSAAEKKETWLHRF